MKKSELETGMIVLLRNGTEFMVVKGTCDAGIIVALDGSGKLELCGNEKSVILVMMKIHQIIGALLIQSLILQLFIQLATSITLMTSVRKVICFGHVMIG